MDEQTQLSKEEIEKFDNATEGVLPKIDVSKYIGKETAIISATPQIKHFNDNTVSHYIKYETDIVETLPNGTIIRASKIVGLQQDEEGALIWGKDTKMGSFLAKYGMKHWKEMVGVVVKMQTVLRNDGKEFLTF